ncbi:universal stress protein [Desulfurivibrio dismutans]|uniref:universal stress protein n=1 Tax=Desulfurivibrio dismutans TaxID=1398908 RepID=UPI0023DA8D66|nr:universal stress protein [Desulfurivibrio alkaliphilus]MDF1613768.1 universal stress protein [Desulfurivibrio alkaliphilus]
MDDVRKILVPVDFSANSCKIMALAASLAQRFKAELAVVFVVQSFDDYSGFFVPREPIAQFEEEMIRNAEEKMQSFIQECLAPDAQVQTRVLTGDVADSIVEHATRTGVDLIVIGTHGYRGLERVLFGSVAEKVIKRADCPVISINPYRS